MSEEAPDLSVREIILQCYIITDRDQYQLGTLSHILNAKATGYQELPQWPEEAPDLSVREIILQCYIITDRDQYQLGTLSHILNAKATGYQELPQWPEEAPDPSVRNVEVPVTVEKAKEVAKKKGGRERGFYSESESSSVGMYAMTIMCTVKLFPSN